MQPETSAPSQQLPWRKAFQVLASVELGQQTGWSGPEDEAELRLRVETLAVLLDVVPLCDLAHMEILVHGLAEFHDHLTSGISASALRQSVRERLRHIQGHGDWGTEKADHGFDRASTLLRYVHSTATRSAIAATVSNRDQPLSEADRHWGWIGLGTWLAQLEKPRWTQMPDPALAGASVAIDKVYIDLFTILDQDIGIGVSDENDDAHLKRSPQRISKETHAVIDAATMVARTSSFCIVVGDPGSGKSTLVQWLARGLARTQMADFDAPLVVRLGPYALSLAEEPDLSVLDYFFDSLDLTGGFDRYGAARCLRASAKGGARYLLLLDGWDEVPASLRERVRERIEEERVPFVTVITSRPSGFPRQLAAGPQTEVYYLAGLSELSRRTLVESRLRACGKEALAPELLQRIESNRDLRDLGCNPFLLTLLVWAMSTDRVSGGNLEKARTWTSMSWSLADIYHMAVAWIIEVARERHDSQGKLLAQSLPGLAQLSYELLFTGTMPRYSFDEEQLMRTVDPAQADAIQQSRFVSRLGVSSHILTFVHATFEEYFAARHTATLPEATLPSLLDRAFFTASRNVVAEFLMGLQDRAGELCRQRLHHWLHRRDRYHQVIFRVARLLASCPRQLQPPALMKMVGDHLWPCIHRTRDLETKQSGVRLLARLDSLELCQKLRQSPETDQFILDCAADALPGDLALSQGITELMDPAMRERVAASLGGGPGAKALAANRALLAQVSPRADEEALRTAVLQAGAAQDREATPSLIALLDDRSLPEEIHQETVTSLGQIGGKEAIRTLVAIVLGDKPSAYVATGLARRALQHAYGGGRHLDPAGRDALLRRIASIPVNEEMRLILMVSALEGFPVRTGTALLRHLAMSRQTPVHLRVDCLQVLQTTLADAEVDALLGDMGREPKEVESLLLATAVQRRRPIPVPWLQQRLRQHSPLPDKEMLLTVALVASDQQLGPASQMERLLAEMAHLALTGPEPSHFDLAGAFRGAVEDWEPQRRYSVPAWIDVTLCTQILQSFERREADLPAERVMLAGTLLGRVSRRECAGHLQSALQACLGRLTPTLLELQKKLLHEVARAFVQALAQLDPQTLLRFPADFEPIHETLLTLSQRRGWLVFDDCILDHEGWPLLPPWEPSLAATEAPAAQPSACPEDQVSGKIIGEIVATLGKAILPGRFEGFLLHRLNRQVSHYAGQHDTYPVTLNRVVQAAKAEGWLRDLIREASQFVPGDANLAALAAKMPTLAETVEPPRDAPL